MRTAIKKIKSLGVHGDYGPGRCGGGLSFPVRPDVPLSVEMDLLRRLVAGITLVQLQLVRLAVCRLGSFRGTYHAGVHSPHSNSLNSLANI